MSRMLSSLLRSSNCAPTRFRPAMRLGPARWAAPSGSPGARRSNVLAPADAYPRSHSRFPCRVSTAVSMSGRVGYPERHARFDGEIPAKTL